MGIQSPGSDPIRILPIQIGVLLAGLVLAGAALASTGPPALPTHWSVPQMRSDPAPGGLALPAAAPEPDRPAPVRRPARAAGTTIGPDRASRPDAAFTRSLTWSGALAVALAVIGMTIVGWRRRRW